MAGLPAALGAHLLVFGHSCGTQGQFGGRRFGGVLAGLVEPIFPSGDLPGQGCAGRFQLADAGALTQDNLDQHLFV